MRDALETSTERTSVASDDTSPHATDPDLLTTDLVRKVMEKSSLQTEQPGTPKPKKRSTMQAKLDEARARRNGVASENAANQGVLRRLTNQAFAAIRSYRPKPLHLRIVTIALIMVVSPWLIPVLTVLTLLICAITYFTLGPDRVAEIAMSCHAWLEKKNPERATALKLRWEATVEKIERWGARLPDKWAPDLTWRKAAPSEELVDKMKVDPFDRLAAEARNT